MNSRFLLTIVALVLGLAGIVCVIINPYAAAGLAAVLVAVSRIVHAISAGDTTKPDTTKPDTTEPAELPQEPAELDDPEG